MNIKKHISHAQKPALEAKCTRTATVVVLFIALLLSDETKNVYIDGFSFILLAVAHFFNGFEDHGLTLFFRTKS